MKKTINKGGRPQKQIDVEEFEKLCALQCTKDEICGWFDITDKTLDAWCKRTYESGFSDIYSKKRGKGKISLRRMQFHLAKTNAAMAIFLGKNYLGQKDIQDGQLGDIPKIEIYVRSNSAPA